VARSYCGKGCSIVTANYREASLKELRFNGRVAVVTGAGRGLGREYAKLLASRGAHVVVNDLGTDPVGRGESSQPAQSVVDEITATGGVAVASTDSVASMAGANAIISTAVGAFGTVDILVNNAGIMNQAPFDDIPLDYFDKQLNVSFYGTLYMTKACWPYLKKSRGNVVNISSASILGTDVLTAYGSAKGAVFAFTRCLAQAAEPFGIRVNAVLPIAATRMADVSGKTVPTQEIRELIAAEMAPEKVAPMVAYLAHQNCRLSGRAFSVGSNRMALVFLGETLGYQSKNPSIEDISQNIEAICDKTTVLDFASCDAMLNWLTETEHSANQ
jgi:NAD(P)-dependent dehydrogenase (short-subunit alcohol dehydrogenase family)